MIAKTIQFPRSSASPIPPLPAARLQDPRPLLVKALCVAGLIAAGFGGWSVSAKLASAALAPGRLVIDGNIKRVQAASTGPIAEIAVAEGVRVEAGAVLLRLDDVQARSALTIVGTQLAEAQAQRYRLMAEREDRSNVDWPPGMTSSHIDWDRFAAEEARLFELRRSVHLAHRSRLAERGRQVVAEIEALDLQQQAKRREAGLVRKERELIAQLERQRLTTLTRPIAIDRDLARFDADEGALSAQQARARSQQQEIELQLVALDSSRWMDAQKELRTVDARIEELHERRRVADDQLERSVIRAPTAGVMHELAVFGKGAVVRPGEVLLTIVPDRKALVTEVRVRPQDIDQIRTGQSARLRFTAFNQQTTPDVDGKVERVAADLQRDPVSGQFHYTATIRISDDEVKRFGALRLHAGMPVEAHIRIGERTVASYLLKPILDQMQRAMKEE